MASSFAWLDYSEHEKRIMLDVIALFGERDTRDELGIGSVRDAFAEMFFPGTSTIQTRARYFLFVPWTYLDLERRRVSSAEVAARARREEIPLIRALAASADQEGIIGIQARENLQRLPSNIYWSGLVRWGICTFNGSQDQYHRSLYSYYRSLDRGLRTDDGEPVDGAARANWSVGIPNPPPGFPQTAEFRLLRAEAQFLRERIMARTRGSLLAFLVDRGCPTAAVNFPWEHPQFGEFPAPIREQLEHARNFSEVLVGAPLLYNLMLSETAGKDDLVASYRVRMARWSEMVALRHEALAKWDLRRFWEVVESEGGARISRLTRQFAEGWISSALGSQSAADLADDEKARWMVRERERQLKRGLARLENRRALEQWTGDAGTGRLNYRWLVAQRILSDVLDGLGREVTDAEA